MLVTSYRTLAYSILCIIDLFTRENDESSQRVSSYNIQFHSIIYFSEARKIFMLPSSIAFIHIS